MSLKNRKSQKDKAVWGATQTASIETLQQAQPTKKEAILKAFIKLGEKGSNCFQSANFHRDYVLRTNDSDLQIAYVLEFSIKWDGDNVRIIDYQESKRAEVTGAINTLQDELPLVAGWQTVRQSYLSETRTRARCYHIPEAFLKEVK